MATVRKPVVKKAPVQKAPTRSQQREEQEQDIQQQERPRQYRSGPAREGQNPQGDLHFATGMFNGTGGVPFQATVEISRLTEAISSAAQESIDPDKVKVKIIIASNGKCDAWLAFSGVAEKQQGQRDGGNYRRGSGGGYGGNRGGGGWGGNRGGGGFRPNKYRGDGWN